MKTGETPWSGFCKIKCCKDCVAPKRYIGCHDTCKEYIIEKEKHKRLKDKRREEIINNPKVTKYDVNKIEFADCKRHKPKQSAKLYEEDKDQK